MVGHAQQNAYPTQNHAEVTVQECVFADDTYKCGVKTKLKSDPCARAGCCLPGRIVISANCVLSNETVICKGRLQEASKPCAGKCPVSKDRQFSETDNEYDYGSNQYGGSLDYKMDDEDNLYWDMQV